MKYYSIEYFETIKELLIEYVLCNYDYCYLEAMHYKCHRDESIDTIVVGSSHAMNGVVESKLLGGTNTINFSISSQDLYYDFLHIKKAVENCRGKIRRCIINIGYYMLYQDLSKSNNFFSIIQQTYYPLFKDSHHYETKEDYDFLSKLSDKRKYYSKDVLLRLCEDWGRGFFIDESSYYGSLKSREENNIFGLKKIKWDIIDEQARIEYAKKRTDGHNKLIKHKESFEENIQIIEQMATYLYEHDIMPIFVIMPFTRYYNEYINAEYKTEIYQVLDKLKVPIEFLDMNDYPEVFEDKDFLDSDHLNLNGALKATELLNIFISEAEGNRNE